MLLVARTDAAHRNLAEQFSGREVEKTYLALVHGRVKQDEGTIKTPITRDPVRSTRMTARLGHGRTALTTTSPGAVRPVHVSGSEDRHRAHAPDSRSYGQHRASGSRRHTVRRRGSGSRPFFLHAWRSDSPARRPGKEIEFGSSAAALNWTDWLHNGMRKSPDEKVVCGLWRLVRPCSRAWRPRTQKVQPEAAAERPTLASLSM